MLRGSNNRCTRGFTLVEVLIALTLSIVLAALLFSALHTYVLTTSASHEHIMAKQLTESVHQFMRGQLREIVPLVLRSGRERKVLFYGDEQKIVYVGHIPSHRSAGGLHKNSLVIDGSPPEQTLIFRYERLAVDESFDHDSFVTTEAGAPRVLMEKTAALEFEYFGSAKPGSDAQWFGRWPAEDHLPELVRVQFDNDNDRSAPDIVVPIYANLPTAHVALSIGQPAKWSLNNVIPKRSAAQSQQTQGPIPEVLDQ